MCSGLTARVEAAGGVYPRSEGGAGREGGWGGGRGMAEVYPAGRMLATPPHPQAHPTPQEYPLHYLSHQVGAPASQPCSIIIFQLMIIQQVLR